MELLTVECGLGVVRLCWRTVSRVSTVNLLTTVSSFQHFHNRLLAMILYFFWQKLEKHKTEFENDCDYPFKLLLMGFGRAGEKARSLPKTSKAWRTTATFLHTLHPCRSIPRIFTLFNSGTNDFSWLCDDLCGYRTWFKTSVGKR